MEEGSEEYTGEEKKQTLNSVQSNERVMTLLLVVACMMGGAREIKFESEMNEDR